MPPPGSRFLAAQLSSLRLVEPSPFPFLPHSHIPNSTSSFRFWESQLFRVESSRIQRLLQAPRSFSNMNQFPLSGHGGSRRGAISEGMDLGGGASQTSNEKERQKEDQCRFRLRLALPHIALITTTLLYVCLGAVIFASIEQPYELQHRNFHMREIRKAEEAIFDYDATSDPHNQTALLLIDHLTLVTFMAFEAGVKPCGEQNS